MKPTEVFTALWHRIREPRRPDTVCGGVRHQVDTNAPKVIASTQITAFSCRTSATGLPRNRSPLAGCCFRFQATKTLGSFRQSNASAVLREFTFRPEESFMDALQKLVDEYHFARYNGTYYSISGLPDFFGTELQIDYASGESVSFSNNQNRLISIDALEALTELFLSQEQL